MLGGRELWVAGLWRHMRLAEFPKGLLGILYIVVVVVVVVEVEVPPSSRRSMIVLDHCVFFSR
jgi:hypothetical protein